jgi:hypothetical protein
MNHEAEHNEYEAQLNATMALVQKTLVRLGVVLEDEIVAVSVKSGRTAIESVTRLTGLREDQIMERITK